ncbi:MAG TPA: hypothetical protein P5234_00480 [Thermoanaerobaculaceae bacterium]|nr:hypothetical protein [Thermoanaerobaculaceae bacterium]HRS14703.1 hypothetical protein [Thermoanaerobaculaceae bacterium]
MTGEEELDERAAEPRPDAGAAAASEGRSKLNADYLLDKVIPGEIDWRDVVRRHPLLAVGAAAAIGFLLGRSRGSAIVAGASAAVTTAVMRQLSDVFEGEVFEF